MQPALDLIKLLFLIQSLATSALSGHTEYIRSLTFSLDGTFLVSGGDDNTVKLWDVQTGGVVKTFHSHIGGIYLASISPDCTTIASGSQDKVCLWDVQMGNCHCVMDISGTINSLRFSLTNSQHLIVTSNRGTIQQWDINGHQIPPSYNVRCAAFSPDGAHFVSWDNMGVVAAIQKFDSGVITADLQLPSDGFRYWYFSSDGKLLAGITSHAAYIWDLTSSEPCLVETFIEHDGFRIIGLSSSHMFSWSSKSIKFWPIGTSSTESSVTDSESPQPTPASIMTITLQAKDGVAISTDLAGVVRVWDILTGLCKSSFHTKAGPQSQRDAKLVDGSLIFVWCTHKKTYIWNTGRKKHLQTMDARSNFSTTRLRISEDGSKVFLKDYEHIQALSTWTGEVVGKVKLESPVSNEPLIVDGSRVWVCFDDSLPKGWDFGIPDSAPVPLSEMPPDPDRPHLGFIDGTMVWDASWSRIEDTVTGKVVYRLPRKYGEPTAAKWDGQYLVAGYESGEILILDFIHMIPQ